MKKILFILFLIIYNTSFATGDIIYFKNGFKVSGKVKEDLKNKKIYIEIGNSNVMEFNLEEITKIEYTPSANITKGQIQSEQVSSKIPQRLNHQNQSFNLLLNIDNITAIENELKESINYEKVKNSYASFIFNWSEFLNQTNKALEGSISFNISLLKLSLRELNNYYTLALKDIEETIALCDSIMWSEDLSAGAYKAYHRILDTCYENKETFIAQGKSIIKSYTDILEEMRRIKKRQYE